MDKEFKTTFIPKKQLSKGKSVAPSKTARRARGIMSLVAVLLLVTAVVSVAGVYLYKARLATVVTGKIESINLAEKAFEPSVILELRKLDIRLRAATELLDNHVAVVDFFESLGETTLPDIQYAGMDIDFSENVPSVSTTGEARGYLPIAQQSDLFEENRYIQNAIFSDFARTDTGRITFSLSFSINPELLVYGRTLQNIDLDDFQGDGDPLNLNPEAAIIEDQSTLLPAGTPVEFNN
jgi:hypothetical protein